MQASMENGKAAPAAENLDDDHCRRPPDRASRRAQMAESEFTLM